MFIFDNMSFTWNKIKMQRFGKTVGLIFFQVRIFNDEGWLAYCYFFALVGISPHRSARNQCNFFPLQNMVHPKLFILQIK